MNDRHAGGGRSAAAAADLPGGVRGPVAGGFRPGGAVGGDARGRLSRRGPAAGRKRDRAAGGPRPHPRPRRHAAGLRSDDPGRGGRVSLAARPARRALAARHGPRAAGRRRIARTPKSWPPPEAEVLAERAELARRLAALCGLSPRAVGRPDAADSGPRRADCRGRQPPPAVGRRRSRARPTTRGRSASAGCCWKTRRRRASSWPRSWTITSWPTTCPRRSSRRSRTTPIVIPARRSSSFRGGRIPDGTLAAHVLGHLGAAADQEGRHSCLPRDGSTAASRRQECLPDDLVGRMGVERQYEAAAARTAGRGRRADRPRRPRGGILLPSTSRSPAATWN